MEFEDFKIGLLDLVDELNSFALIAIDEPCDRKMLMLYLSHIVINEFEVKQEETIYNTKRDFDDWFKGMM